MISGGLYLFTMAIGVKTAYGQDIQGLLNIDHTEEFALLSHNYLMISPALIWDDHNLFTLDHDRSKASSAPLKIFTAVGDLDEVKIIRPWKDMNLLFHATDFPQVSWVAREYEGQTHSNI